VLYVPFPHKMLKTPWGMAPTPEAPNALRQRIAGRVLSSPARCATAQQ
jgi:hypothetical protein